MEIKFHLYSKQDADKALSAITALRPLLIDIEELEKLQPFDCTYVQGNDATQNAQILTVEEPVVTNGTFSKEDAAAAMASLAAEATKRKRRTKAEIEAEKAKEAVAAEVVTENTDNSDLMASLTAQAEEPENLVDTIEEAVEEIVETVDEGLDDLMAAFGLTEEEPGEPAEYADKSDDELRKMVVARIKEPSYGAKWLTDIMVPRGIKKPSDLTRADLVFALQQPGN